MESKSLLTLLREAVMEGNGEKMKSILDVLPVEKLDDVTSDKLLVDSLVFALHFSTVPILSVRAIVSRWIEADIDGYLTSTPTYLFKKLEVPEEVFRALAEAFPERDYFSYVYELISDDSSPEVALALTRLDTVFGDQSLETYQALKNLIVKQEKTELYLDVVGTFNQIVLEYLDSHLDEVSAYAPVPSWIENFEEDPEYVPFEEEFFVPDIPPAWKELPSSEEAVRLIVDRLESTVRLQIQQGAEELTVKQLTDQAREAFVVLYNASTLEEKIRLLEPTLTIKQQEDLENDVVLFRLLGPSNPVYGLLPNPQETTCGKYGCRMFTCIDFENEDEFGILDEEDPCENVEWFTGACEVCHQKIAKKIYALRRPLTFGGWKGTFCSFPCLREAIPMYDILNLFLVQYIENQLNEIGIQDRRYPGEEAEGDSFRTYSRREDGGEAEEEIPPEQILEDSEGPEEIPQGISEEKRIEIQEEV